MSDVLQVLPFRNELEMVRIKGDVILQALEHSASLHNPLDARSGFLQVSGEEIFQDTTCHCPLHLG